jgi:hypothetical protein
VAAFAISASVSGPVACAGSESPSPFVNDRDAGEDARAPTSDAAFIPPIPVDGSAGAPTPGEWGGPCLDDGQCDDGVECTHDSCDADQGRCHFAPVDAPCDDGEYCNGAEVCVPAVGCRPGEPVACSDGTACTIDSCDEETHACQHVPRDADGDGDPDGNCTGGHDCNDTDPTVSSLAKEICGNGVDDDCDGLADESPCISPKYDTCAHPLSIDAAGSFSLSLEAAALDYSATCVKTNPRFHDLVASIVVPKGGASDVDIVLTTESSSTTLGLSAMSHCGDASSEFACAAGVEGADAGAVARLTLHSLVPGTYAVVLFADAPGPVRLTVDFLPPRTAPANETCGTSTPLVEGEHVTAALAGASSDLRTHCQGALGELVYDFTLDAPKDVHVHATANDSFGTPIVSLRDANCDELACREEPNDDLYRRALPAGHYFVAIDATGPSDVDVVLETAPPSTPPDDESCDGPPALVPGATRVVTLADHVDDVDTGCSVGYPDAVYALSLESTSDVLLVEETADGDQGAVSLARTDCASRDSLACSTAGASPVRATARALPRGEYRAVVESELGLATSITAFVRPATEAVLVPFSDTCKDSPTEIPATGGLFKGNTANASDDFTASCDVGGSGGAPDQVLHFALGAASRVIFDARGSAYSVIVDIRSGASCPGQEITSACSAGYVRNRSYLDLSLAPGDYWVQIDGYDGSSGVWALDVYVDPK